MVSRWLGVCIVVSLGLSSSALGDQKAKLSVPTSKLKFITDGKGHYLAYHSNPAYLFYSNDGKRFYKQHILGHSSSGASLLNYNFWAPNASFRRPKFVVGSSPYTGQLLYRDSSWNLRCGESKTGFFAVSQKRRARLLKASFLAPKHRRALAFLGRDDNGIYYVMDRLQRELGGGDERFFRGQAGQMKRLKIRELLDDGVGILVRTDNGVFSKNRISQKNTWRVSDGAITEVFSMSPTTFESLAYTRLGIYPDRLGTPCDDL